MTRSKYTVRNGHLELKKAGIPKFVNCVDKVCFSAAEALKARKRVFYVTSVEVFELTQAGLEIRQLMPGIDLHRDILRNPGGARFIVPDGPIPLVPLEVISGERFELKWDN